MQVALELYEKGMKLTVECRDYLKSADQKVSMISNKNDRLTAPEYCLTNDLVVTWL